MILWKLPERLKRNCAPYSSTKLRPPIDPSCLTLKAIVPELVEVLRVKSSLLLPNAAFDPDIPVSAIVVPPIRKLLDCTRLALTSPIRSPVTSPVTLPSTSETNVPLT